MAKGFPRALSRAPIGTELFIKRFRYPIVNKTVTVTATGSAVGFGTVAIGALPESNILYFGGCAYLGVTTTDADVGATWSGLASFGTGADANGAYAGNEIDLIPQTAIGPAVAKTISGAAGRVGAANGIALLPFMFDNTAKTLNINLNILVNNADMADTSAADLIVNGFVDLFFACVGDD